MSRGTIVRGPTDLKRLALVFTGHEFAEGAETILRELRGHDGRASFFLTGAFLDQAPLAPLIRRMHADGHYVGPHSDQHLLYCEWDAARTLRVTEAEFVIDLRENVAGLEHHGIRERHCFFVPPYEHYNAAIADWSAALGWTLVSFTPGTRSNADYTGEADPNFVSSQAILDSILNREREDPQGLNGFILLLHLGSGPGRTDKFHDRLGELLDELQGRGYAFVRVDELLANAGNAANE